MHLARCLCDMILVLLLLAILRPSRFLWSVACVCTEELFYSCTFAMFMSQTCKHHVCTCITSSERSKNHSLRHTTTLTNHSTIVTLLYMRIGRPSQPDSALPSKSFVRTLLVREARLFAFTSMNICTAKLQPPVPFQEAPTSVFDALSLLGIDLGNYAIVVSTLCDPDKAGRFSEYGPRTSFYADDGVKVSIATYACITITKSRTLDWKLGVML